MVPVGDYESLGGKLEGLHDKLVESYVRLVNESLLGRFGNPASHSPRATRGLEALTCVIFPLLHFLCALLPAHARF